MNTLIKMIMLIFCLQTGDTITMELPPDSHLGKSLLHALLGDDYQSAVRCFHEDRMILSSSDVRTWATHYYNTEYSKTKYNIAKLVLLSATYYENIPSLKELAAQKIAQLRVQDRISIKAVPADLAEIVHKCPAFSLHGLQKHCSLLTEAEKFILMNRMWDIWDADMPASRILTMSAIELNKFIKEREQTISRMAKIFFNIRFQDYVHIDRHTKSINSKKYEDVDTILAGINSDNDMYDAVIGRLRKLILDAAFQQEEWIGLIKVKPENEREIEFEHKEKAKCCILQ